MIAETREWRKICDPDGSVAWIHRTVASGRRSVFNRSAEEIMIHSGRSATSSVRARLSPRSIVATGVFMAVAALTVFVTRHLLGGLA